jgi:hypothetical protein
LEPDAVWADVPRHAAGRAACRGLTFLAGTIWSGPCRGTVHLPSLSNCPRARGLITLRDAALFITKLPTAEHDGQVRCYRKSGCDRRLLPLYPEFFLRHPRRGTRPLLRHRAPAMRRDVRRDLCRYRLAVCTKVGSLFRDHVHASEWRIGLRLSPAQQHRSHGRIALPLLKAADYLASPSTTGQGGLVPVRAAAGLRVDQERDRLGADRARVGDWSKYESAVGTNAKCRPR